MKLDWIQSNWWKLVYVNIAYPLKSRSSGYFQVEDGRFLVSLECSISSYSNQTPARDHLFQWKCVAFSLSISHEVGHAYANTLLAVNTIWLASRYVHLDLTHATLNRFLSNQMVSEMSTFQQETENKRKTVPFNHFLGYFKYSKCTRPMQPSNLAAF